MKNALRVGAVILSGLIFGSNITLAQESERQLAMDNYRQYYSLGKAQDAKKEKSIRQYREYYGRNPYRTNSAKLAAADYISDMADNGIFDDLKKWESELIVTDGSKLNYSEDQQAVGLLLTEAFGRIWKIAEEFRSGRITPKRDRSVFEKLQKSILYYGNLELRRSNKVNRFHASCFAIPTAAVNIYFCLLKQMDEIEQGKKKDKQLAATCDVLKALAIQSWTQPFRHDETDKDVVQIERFRNHVWWVGGNALAYRSLLPVAVMYHSVPMVDLLSEVCQRGISVTSQHTYQDAFWTEGFTADGAGWGHGKQCLVWGYPIDGTIYALGILSTLKNSPWEKQLGEGNKDALLNFFRGSNWYYYKGFIPPCLDRGSMVYNPNTAPIRYRQMLNILLKDFTSSFTPEELAELNQLHEESDSHLISMENLPVGMYNGTRWFFNNDDLIKKNDAYQILVNMASVRCDGLESATNMADEYNFYTADGLTLFQKNGDEYRKIIGAADVTALPGITAREGMDKLLPVTNWRGYCSKYNFAAGATRGGENAVAGFIFEKMNASEKEGVNDRGDSNSKNAILYGVKAYKSYFMLGDYMVALGAGITNMNPALDGDIRTTIEQTAHEAPVYSVCDGEMKEVSAKNVQEFSSTNNNPVWLLQKGKFAYTTVPAYTKSVSYVCETKQTDWLKRNRSNKGKKDLPLTANILRIWINHGQQPVDAAYGYVVYAGENVPHGPLPFNVLSNDTLVQAIESTDSSVIEAIFYQPSASLKTSAGFLKVSAPCAVLIEKHANNYLVTITDARMDKDCKEITVTWREKQFSVAIPQNKLAGQPITIEVD